MRGSLFLGFSMLSLTLLLTACMQQRNSYEQGLIASNQQVDMIRQGTYSQEKSSGFERKTIARRHFERGEQVGDEVPFTSGRKVKATADNLPEVIQDTNTKATDGTPIS